jgi:hypothetical protein
MFEAIPLAVLEQRHAAALARGKAAEASQLRENARAKARKLGLAIPPWAAVRPHGERAGTKKPRRVLPVKRAPRTYPAPLELPPALQAWKRSSGGHVVQVHADGRITLLRSDGRERFQATFPSVKAAAEAVVPPVAWKRIDRESVFGKIAV